MIEFYQKMFCHILFATHLQQLLFYTKKNYFDSKKINDGKNELDVLPCDSVSEILSKSVCVPV